MTKITALEAALKIMQLHADNLETQERELKKRKLYSVAEQTERKWKRTMAYMYTIRHEIIPEIEP